MLEKLTDRVYYLPYQDEGCQPSLGLIIGDKYSLVVDAGNNKSHAEEFLAEVSKLNVAPLKYLTITHFHWDHIAGMSTMNLTSIINEKNYENINIIKDLLDNDEKLKPKELGRTMHRTANQLRKEIENGIEVVNGDIIFEKRIQIDLGGVKCTIENIGGDHSSDSNLIYVEDEKVMFLGDSTYRDLNQRHKCHTMEKSVSLIEKIQKYDTEIYLTAHKPAYTKESMKELFDMMLNIGELVGDSANLDEKIDEYKRKVNRELTEEEVFYIDAFVNGNVNKKSI